MAAGYVSIMNLTESILFSATEHLAGYVYGSTGRERTDCVRLTFAILYDVYGRAVTGRRGDLMVYDTHRPWSPITGAVALGIGSEVTEPTPGCWHLCQGWRELTDEGHVPNRRGPNGHAWLWYQPPTPTGDRGYIVQATTTPPPWCERRLWSWQAQRFPAGVKLVELNEVTL